MNRTDHATNATAVAAAGPAAGNAVRLRFAGFGVLFFAGLLGLATFLTGGTMPTGTAVAAAVYLLAVGLAWRGLAGYPHRALGLCNVVTLCRLMLVCGLIAALVSPGAGSWTILVLATITLSLDGVDGWLARRGGHVSDFGARFDMEVDGVLALVLALLAYAGGHAGIIVVLLGLPLYLFRAAQYAMPWLTGDLPERFSRKLVCVVQIAVLILVLVPVVDRWLADVVAALTVAALVWSFALDIRLLWRART